MRDVSGPVPADGPAVLCVDDSATNRRIIELAMRYRPHVELLQAGDGAEALRLAFERRPALILLDGNLPDINGQEVLRRLKAAPATRSIPVVVVTGEHRREILDGMRAAGATDCIVKPIDLDRLLDLVDVYAPAPSPPGPSTT